MFFKGRLPVHAREPVNNIVEQERKEDNYMKEILQKLNEFLPSVETFVDCNGKVRKFELRLERALEPGYLLSAVEVGGVSDYEFEVFAEYCPFNGLGRLRQKIRRGLSRRYIVTTKHGLSMTHDEISGRISNTGVIVDGAEVTWEEFETILLTHEGFQIDIRISGGDE
jgi:hypothetical protein